MSDERPSLAKRILAVVVLAVVALLAVRLVLGVISALVWLVAVVALIVVGLWAASTLRSARRGREPKAQVPPAPEDRLEAEMRKLQQQLRDQGRL